MLKLLTHSCQLTRMLTPLLQATMRGGAIYARAEAQMVITGSSFKANAALSGGAVHATTTTNATLAVSNTVFADNRAVGSNVGAAGTAPELPSESSASGGAIGVLGPMVVVLSGVQASNHSAQDYGGMLFCNSCYSLSLADSSISGSSAGGAGGAVLALNLTGPSLVHRTTFLRNAAGGKGRYGPGQQLLACVSDLGRQCCWCRRCSSICTCACGQNLASLDCLDPAVAAV
jgi:hypothetical protein